MYLVKILGNSPPPPTPTDRLWLNIYNSYLRHIEKLAYPVFNTYLRPWEYLYNVSKLLK